MPSGRRAVAQPFKHQINARTLAATAATLAPAAPGLDVAAFVADARAGLEALELKPRVHHVAAALERHLLVDADGAGLVVDAALADPAAGMWTLWPLVEWVGRRFRDEPAVAYALLGRLTARSTAEWTVRPFYDADPDGALVVLRRWVGSDEEHLRRLASESTRPRLPWAPRSAAVDADPTWALWVLDALRHDPTPSVRRSVANHLNDLTRVAPELAMATARRWVAEGGAHTDEVVRHALRSRVKAGDADALRLLGVPVDAVVVVSGFVVRTPDVELGDPVVFGATLCLAAAAPEPVEVVVDYGISYARPPAPAPVGRKVFKLAKLTLRPGVPVAVERRHPLKPVTIRRYHPGTHTVDLQVNGRVLAAGPFTLTLPPD